MDAGQRFQRASRVVLAVLFLVLGIMKLMPTATDREVPSGLFAALGRPAARTSIALIELAVGTLLASMRSLGVAWPILLAMLFLGMIGHVVDVLLRGTNAVGCGCFGPTTQSAGVDLMRASVVFLAALLSHRAHASGSTAMTRRSRWAALIGLALCFVLAPALRAAVRPSPSSSHTPTPTPAVVSWILAPRPVPRGIGGDRRSLPDASSPETSRSLRLHIENVDRESIVGASVERRVPSTIVPSVPDGARLAVSDGDGDVELLAPSSPDTSVAQLRISAPGYAPRVIEQADAAAGRSVVTLARGRAATASLRTTNGEPLPGVAVAFRELEEVQDVLGRRPSFRPIIAISDAAGVARVGELRSDATYHVSPAPGTSLARPMSGPGPYLRPTQESIEVVLDVAWMTSMLAIDASTGEPISTASWGPPDGRERSWMPAERTTGDWRLMGLTTGGQIGERREVLVPARRTGGHRTGRYARYQVSAPGFTPEYIEAEVTLVADAVKRGPQRVALRRSEALGTIIVKPRGPMRTNFVTVELRNDRGRRISVRALVGGDEDADIIWKVPAGAYRVLPGGDGALPTVDVRAGETTTVEFDDQSWLPVRLRCTRRGVLVDDVLSILVVGTSGELIYTRDNVVASRGLTPIFGVPRGGPVEIGVSAIASPPTNVAFSSDQIPDRILEVSVELPDSGSGR